MIKSFAAVHLCYPAISLSYLMCWALQKIRCTNKIKFWGLTPFYFRICLMIYFCLTGSCPPHFLGTKTTSSHAGSSLCHKTAAACSCPAELKPSAGAGGDALDCGRGCLPTVESLPVRPADAQLLREPWTFRAFQIRAWGPWIRFGESGPKNIQGH